MGSTTYSFCVRLRCFFPAIPHGCVKIKDGLLMPEEPECHLRRTLYKGSPSPSARGTMYFMSIPRADISRWWLRAGDSKSPPKACRGSTIPRYARGTAYPYGRRGKDGRHMGFWTQIQSGEELVYGLDCIVAWKYRIAKDCLSQAASSPSYAEFRQRIETDLSNLSSG